MKLTSETKSISRDLGRLCSVPSIDPEETSTSKLSDILPLWRSKPGPDAVSFFESEKNGPGVEQFRLMQRRLNNAHPQGGIVLVTSPAPGDGKSVNAHNLAWALAEAGRPTLLLDLDLRRPIQTTYFRATLTRTLLDVLQGECSASSAARSIPGLPLYLLGTSSPAPNPAELLRGTALAEIMRWARRSFAWTIIDAPPILPVADTEELLPSADIVLLTVRQRVTPRASIESSVERLGKRLHYIIFNAVETQVNYGYYEYK